jgi:DNA-directed RNA polymerase specialized sigma24 family protein
MPPELDKRIRSSSRFDSSLPVDSLASGDDDAWNAFLSVDRQRGLRSLALGLVSSDNAEDIVQGGIVRFYSALRNGACPPNPSVYLATCVISEGRDFHRRRFREKAKYNIAGTSSLMGAPQPEPEAVASYNSLVDSLLPLGQASLGLLIAIEVEGAPGVQVARDNSIPIGTVKSRLHRAQVKARELIDT